MVYPVSAGAPQYSGTFIPELWSGKLIEQFYDTTVLSQISNTDYEGEIKKHGDTVNIRTTPTITIRDYVKGQPLEVENPESPTIQLLINKGKYFNCHEDDVDKVQSDIDMMNLWAKDASEQMKILIDTDVLANIVTEVSAFNEGATAGRISGDINLGVTSTPVALTSSNILSYIVDMGTVLDEANCPESDRFLLLPAKAVGLIKKSDLKDASLAGDSASIMRNGRIGMIDRFTIYSTHNLPVASGETDIIAGHKMGFTFASQMTEMDTLKSTTTFGMLMRGLQVYGYKTVKPQALAHGVISL